MRTELSLLIFLNIPVVKMAPLLPSSVSAGLLINKLVLR